MRQPDRNPDDMIVAMETASLSHFITVNRAELMRRCGAKAAARFAPPTAEDGEGGIAILLDQIIEALDSRHSTSRQIGTSAIQHGRNLFFRGFTIGQVVHDYGDVCQAVTEFATESGILISTDDFHILNRCLDDAIAGAVAEYSHQQRIVTDGLAESQSVQARNLLYSAITAFEVLRSGRVGVGGSTGDLVYRSLVALRGVL